MLTWWLPGCNDLHLSLLIPYTFHLQFMGALYIFLLTSFPFESKISKQILVSELGS